MNYGLVGYQALPPVSPKCRSRQTAPSGDRQKTLPASMINDLPYYPGYEWRAVGDDLVALSTAIVTAVINGVFD